MKSSSDTESISKSPGISVVLAAKNAASFLPAVFESLSSSIFRDFEVIVVDDCSSDETAAISEQAGAAVVRLNTKAGAAAARNRGAAAAKAPLLFFTDHDCCFQPDTLTRVDSFFQTARDGIVLGGTYTLEPYDSFLFASSFQSLHVHYSETRKSEPDYIASHCLAMPRKAFLQEGGFPEHLSRTIPNGCCQDILFSHILKSRGHRLVVDPDLQVKHIFNFTVQHSLYNAFWKSRAWTQFALGEAALLRDSGSASSEMKASAFLLAGSIIALLASFLFGPLFLAFPVLAIGSVLVNARFYGFIAKKKDLWFAAKAAGLYSLQLLAILAGGAVGILRGRIRIEPEEK